MRVAILILVSLLASAAHGQLLEDYRFKGRVVDGDGNGIAKVEITFRNPQSGKRIVLTVGAGMPTKRVCALALKQGWRGMNFALGIPGTLGGAVWMNAGTALGWMADRLVSITVLSGEGQKVILMRDQIGGQYRHGNRVLS